MSTGRPVPRKAASKELGVGEILRGTRVSMLGQTVIGRRNQNRRKAPADEECNSDNPATRDSRRRGV